MIIASVCSGIGGAELAFEGLGTHAFMAEIDPFARTVLKEHFPHVQLCGDFTEIAASAGPVDVLVGGTPCQSFSVAGLRGGMADARGNLALEFLRLAERLRAEWVLWENVPGVLSSNEGRDFGAFIGGLAELGYGYCWRVLDAQFFGLAQRRKRVFVVGHLGDWRHAAAVLFEPASLRGDSAPCREARKRTAAILTRGADSSGRGGYAGRRREDDSNLVAHTLNTHRAGSATEDGTGSGVPLVAASLRGNSWADNAGDESKLVAYGGNRQSGPVDIATAVNAHGGPHGRLDFESETFVTAYDILGTPATRGGAETNVHTALRSRAPGASEASTTTVVSHASLVRRLTPTECERLQGYPQGWTDVPFRGRPAADGNRYCALGNAFAVPVVRWIARRIAAEAAA